ncbi:hypothetical protein BH09PAT2_BH09PAT2_08090 [soil metagenome]
MPINKLFAILLSSFLVLLSVVFVPKIEAATYYVDGASLGGTCNNSNNGTALATPWCTVSKAAGTATAGDVVNIRGATYRETATVANSGTSGSPITFQKYLSETPIINAADVPSTWISLGNAESGGLFSSGFESGDLTEYTSSTVDVTNTTTVQSSVINHGLYAMKTVFGGTAANGKVSKTITSSNDLYSRIYFQMAAGFDLAATGSRFDILYIRKDSSTNLARASIVKNGSNSFSIQGRIEAPTGSSYAAQTFYSGTAGEITTGTWYSLELRYKGQDATTGGAQIWLNNVSKGSVLSLNTVGVNNTPARIEVGGNSSAATVPTVGSILYIDDVKANTSAVGSFTAAGNANIYKATGVNWTVRQVFEDAALLTEETSLAAVTAAGEWYVDTTANILYVWSTNSASPGTHLTEASNRNIGFDLSSRNYIKLNGLTIKYANNTSYGGVHLVSSGNNILTNLTLSDNVGSGAYLNSSTSNTISNNQILRNGRSFGGGIRLQNGSSNNTVSGNTITGMALDGGNGISLCGDSTCNSTGNNSNTISGNTFFNLYDTCIYLDTNNDSNTIEKNICHDSYRTSSSSGGNGIHLALGSDSNIIRNNIIYKTQRHGISLRDGNASQGYVNNNNNQIYNNTIYSIGYGGGALGESGNAINLQGSNSNNVIYNNIISKAKDAAINIDPGSISTTTSDYNLFYNVAGSGIIADYNSANYSSLSSYQTASNQDTHSYSADPLFVNEVTYNFLLQIASPAINVGTSIANFFEDLANNVRPQGGIYDIGAYESSVIPTSTPSPSPVPTVTTTSSSNSSDSSPDTSFHPPSCNEQRPASAPDFFQIDRIAGTATLYFSPAQNPYTKYMVFYGTNDNTEQYAVVFDSHDAKGVISYTIHELNPKSAYSFKVQAANGCMAGDWSNTLKAGALRAKKQSFYRYSNVKKLPAKVIVPKK